MFAFGSKVGPCSWSGEGSSNEIAGERRRDLHGRRRGAPPCSCIKVKQPSVIAGPEVL